MGEFCLLCVSGLGCSGSRQRNKGVISLNFTFFGRGNFTWKRFLLGDCRWLPVVDCNTQRAITFCEWPGCRPRNAFRTTAHWATLRRASNVDKPAPDSRSSWEMSSFLLVFRMRRAALLLFLSRRTASDDVRPLQTTLLYSTPGRIQKR